jgi:hypothetical protein
MSAFGGKADMRRTSRDVCYSPKADIGAIGIKGRVWLFLRRQPVATCCDLALQKGNRSKGHMKRRQFLVNVGFAAF